MIGRVVTIGIVLLVIVFVFYAALQAAGQS